MAGMFGIRSEDIIPGAQGARPTQPAAPPPNPVQQQMMQLANARQLPQPPAPGPSVPFMQSRTGQELAGIGRAAAPVLANVGMAVARPFQESVMGQAASRAYQDTQRAADAGRNMEALGASGRMLAAGAGAALEVPTRGIGMALQEVGNAGREFWRGVTGAGQPAPAPVASAPMQAAPAAPPSPTAMSALDAAEAETAPPAETPTDPRRDAALTRVRGEIASITERQAAEQEAARNARAALLQPRGAPAPAQTAAPAATPAAAMTLDQALQRLRATWAEEDAPEGPKFASIGGREKIWERKERRAAELARQDRLTERKKAESDLVKQYLQETGAAGRLQDELGLRRQLGMGDLAVRARGQTTTESRADEDAALRREELAQRRELAGMTLAQQRQLTQEELAQRREAAEMAAAAKASEGFELPLGGAYYDPRTGQMMMLVPGPDGVPVIRRLGVQ
jgi:hypothetical protein